MTSLAKIEAPSVPRPSCSFRKEGLVMPCLAGYTYGQSTGSVCELTHQTMTANLISRRRPLLTMRSSGLICLVLVLTVQLFVKDADLVADLLIRTLEERFKRADVRAFEKLSGIIVLIGGD